MKNSLGCFSGIWLEESSENSGDGQNQVRSPKFGEESIETLEQTFISRIELSFHSRLENFLNGPERQEDSSNGKTKNLSVAIANRYPIKIKNQVLEMIKYYQTIIKKQEDELKKIDLAKMSDRMCRKNKEILENRIESLEAKLLEKDKMINNLNSEITQLVIRARRYKRANIDTRSCSEIKLR